MQTASFLRAPAASAPYSPTSEACSTPRWVRKAASRVRRRVPFESLAWRSLPLPLRRTSSAWRREWTRDRSRRLWRDFSVSSRSTFCRATWIWQTCQRRWVGNHIPWDGWWHPVLTSLQTTATKNFNQLTYMYLNIFSIFLELSRNEQASDC